MPRYRSFLVPTLVAASLWVGVSAPTLACSAFLLKNGEICVVGRNYDWHTEDALVMVNKRDIQKKALSFDNPAQWVSKYGSVTINQYGRELPCDGMNEKGLMISLLWLSETRYPEPDQRPSITNSQWAQYQLDTAASVEEVVASDKKIRITNLGGALVHYFVADANGNAAVIEFLDGKMRATTGDQLPYAAITNRNYTDSLQYLKQHAGFGGQRTFVRSPSSFNRFVGSVLAVKGFAEAQSPTLELAKETIFRTLEIVDQGDRTKWRLAYDLAGCTIQFRTHTKPSPRSLDLKSLDFDGSTPVQLVDINAIDEGDLRTALSDYTIEANRDQMRRAVNRTPFARALPNFLLEQAARYPDLNCVPVENAIVAGEKEVEKSPVGQ